MADNKLKKKIALIKATAHAFGIHHGIDAQGKEALESILKSSEEAKALWENEKFEESRQICHNNLSVLINIAQTLSPARLRKALLRQLEKINKY
jgi:hypothetical protein